MTDHGVLHAQGQEGICCHGRAEEKPKWCPGQTCIVGTEDRRRICLFSLGTDWPAEKRKKRKKKNCNFLHKTLLLRFLSQLISFGNTEDLDHFLRLCWIFLSLTPALPWSGSSDFGTNTADLQKSRVLDVHVRIFSQERVLYSTCYKGQKLKIKLLSAPGSAVAGTGFAASKCLKD